MRARGNVASKARQQNAPQKRVHEGRARNSIDDVQSYTLCRGYCFGGLFVVFMVFSANKKCNIILFVILIITKCTIQFIRFLFITCIYSILPHNFVSGKYLLLNIIITMNNCISLVSFA